jgi:hypothetical protein
MVQMGDRKEREKLVQYTCIDVGKGTLWAFARFIGGKGLAALAEKRRIVSGSGLMRPGFVITHFCGAVSPEKGILRRFAPLEGR